MPTWISTTSTAMTLPVNWTLAPSFYSPPVPKPPTPLEWLDQEIERTCELARTA